MSPRPKKAEDADVFAALVRVMSRRGPGELTLREIADEAGVTAGALVQRFGSKRSMLLAHARYAATTGDVGIPAPQPKSASPLDELRSAAAMYAALASSPSSAVRNFAYLLNDLSDAALRRHLLRLSRDARGWYAELLHQAKSAGELRADTDIPSLARLVEATLRGSLLGWTLYREGASADWLAADLDALLAPYRATARARKARQR